MGPKLKLARQRVIDLKFNLRDRALCLALIEKLNTGINGGEPSKTLASSVYSRELRLGLIPAIHNAFDEFAGTEICTATIIKEAWSFAPEQLDTISAATLKNRFMTDLKRTGVADFPGPLFAVLHCEFESTSGKFYFHFHLITTVAKYEFLSAQFKKLRDYKKMARGSQSMRKSDIGNRVRQFSYVFKSYWGQRTWRPETGKRDRYVQRVPEPFHSQSLLWLDQQAFSDLVVMNGCWSPKSGGTEAMRALYLFVQGQG